MTNGMFLAVRGIGAEFARRLWKSSLVTALIVTGLSIALVVWLTSFGAGWWFLLVPVAMGVSIMTALLFVFYKTIRHVRPDSTSEQRAQITAFVDKLQTTSELFGTPKFMILFRVIRSIAAPRSESFLADLASTKTLQHDFTAICTSFNKK